MNRGFPRPSRWSNLITGYRTLKRSDFMEALPTSVPGEPVEPFFRERALRQTQGERSVQTGGCDLLHMNRVTLPAAYRSVQQLFSLGEHGVEHLMGQAPGLGVLLAGVVRPDKDHSTVQG